MLDRLLKEEYRPDDPRWGFTLPPPTDRNYSLNGKGYLVQEINPTYLSYWNPDSATAGTFLSAAAFCLLALALALPPIFLFRQVKDSGASWHADLVVVAIFSGVIAWLLYMCWSAIRKPLSPPVYFNRVTKQVIGWSKDFGWMTFDWERVTPVMKRFTLYNVAGRQTIYTLALLDVDKNTQRINGALTVFPPERTLQPLREAWEFMRRYMNESAQDVPPAFLSPRDLRSHKHWVVRMQAEALQTAFDGRTGQLQGSLPARLLTLTYGALVYPIVAAAIFVERRAPKVPLSPALAEVNRWAGQANPYRHEGYDDSINGVDVNAVYDRVQQRHRWLMFGGFGVYSLLVLLIGSYAWIAMLCGPGC